MPRRKAIEPKNKIEKKAAAAKPKAAKPAAKKENKARRAPVTVKRSPEQKPSRPTPVVVDFDEELEVEREEEQPMASAQPGNPRDEERSKNVIMWSGVTFFMVVFVVIWAFNMKQVFNAQPSTEAADLDIDEITANFNKAMEEVSESLDKFDELRNASSTAATSTDFVATSTDETFSTTTIPSATLPATETSSSTEAQAQIEALRARLEELEGKIDQKK